MASGLGGGSNAQIVGLPNILAPSTVVVSAGSTVASMPATNLQTNEPSEVARLSDVNPSVAYWAFNTNDAFQVDRAALIGHTLVPGDEVRCYGYSVLPPSIVSQKLPPTAIEASTNITGVVGNVDENPSSPDASYITPTSTSLTWTVRFSFATPTDAPATGSNYQCFVLWVERVGTAASVRDYPQLTCSLYESGSLVSVLGTKLVGEVGGQYLFFSWDAADLADTTGADAECLISCTTGETTYARLDAIEWQSLDSDDQGDTDFDTGWVVVAGATANADWGNTSAASLGVTPKNIDLVAGASTNHVVFELRADSMQEFVSHTTTPYVTPNGFIDVGVAVAGPAFTLPYNFAPGAGVGAESSAIGVSRSFGGQTYAVVSYRSRYLRDIVLWADDEVIAEVISRLDFASGSTIPFLMILAPGDTEPIRRHTSLWVTIESSSGAVFTGEYAASGLPIMQVTYSFREKL